MLLINLWLAVGMASSVAATSATYYLDKHHLMAAALRPLWNWTNERLLFSFESKGELLVKASAKGFSALAIVRFERIFFLVYKTSTPDGTFRAQFSLSAADFTNMLHAERANPALAVFSLHVRSDAPAIIVKIVNVNREEAVYKFNHSPPTGPPEAVPFAKLGTWSRIEWDGRMMLEFFQSKTHKDWMLVLSIASNRVFVHEFHEEIIVGSQKNDKGFFYKSTYDCTSSIRAHVSGPVQVLLYVPALVTIATYAEGFDLPVYLAVDEGGHLGWSPTSSPKRSSWPSASAWIRVPKDKLVQIEIIESNIKFRGD
ncbi:hypothetical protein M3Y99_00415000 [Aphelenchoides fujianensis]|nr:hypothetical protein M3Y99_00415000 [Aphelenchoides fujianensis]